MEEYYVPFFCEKLDSDQHEVENSQGDVDTKMK